MKHNKFLYIIIKYHQLYHLFNKITLIYAFLPVLSFFLIVSNIFIIFNQFLFY